MKKAMKRGLLIITCCFLGVVALCELWFGRQNSKLGIGDIVVNIPASDKTMVSVVDFGADPNAADNYQAFQNAIDYCRKNHISRLLIPTDSYKFSTDKPLALNGLKNFTLDGKGSELIFSKLKNYFSIKNCTRIAIKNLSVDWDWNVGRIGTLGQITYKSGNTFDIQFNSESCIDPHMVWNLMYSLEPDTWTSAVEGGKTFGVDVLKFLNIQKISADKLRCTTITSYIPSNIQVGEWYMVRHYDYQANSFKIAGGKDLTFDNITVYSSPGQGWQATDVVNWQIINSKIMLKPDTDRYITTATDGLYIFNTKGCFLFENNVFGYTGDDQINIHDNISQGLTVINANTIMALNVLEWRNKFQVGDTIEFFNIDMSPLGFSSEIKTVAYFPSNAACMLSFVGEIPAGIATDSILVNSRYDSSHYIIRNNAFLASRVRGILLQVGDGYVENNRFWRTRAAALQLNLVVENRWAEGPGASDMIISNNIFDTCNVNDLKNQFGNGVVFIGSYLSGDISTYPIHKNISIYGNTFIDTPSYSMYISSADNVDVSKNIIRNPSSRKMNLAERSIIWAEKASNITIKNNEWLESPYTINTGVKFDAATVTNLTEEDNVLNGR